MGVSFGLQVETSEVKFEKVENELVGNVTLRLARSCAEIPELDIIGGSSGDFRIWNWYLSSDFYRIHPVCVSQSGKDWVILKRLRRYGISGILSYGILNTVYYVGTFLLV
ncbi:hypothetical protein RJ639_032463 [Escallonia herrerae]|uniref:Uncharacterized protein n=1 Tax=Escallonia herrerae TaxID=1293975 RepID=A0AA88WVY9_9ASTE|nr:hypothetical protein RJ639_032463 [Escallonia herrerae]